MRSEIRIAARHWLELTDHLLADESEHAALLLCGSFQTAQRTVLLVRQVVPLSEADLEPGSQALHLQIRPVVFARCAKMAALQGLTLAICHSHPFPGRVRASRLDLATEEELCGRVLLSRLRGSPVGALVLGPEGFDGRLWTSEGSLGLDAIVVVGEEIQAMTAGGLATVPGTDAELFDRQVRTWGVEGQEQLREATITVVGVGGTGSHCAVQLAHLGVGHLVLVDDDHIELSNLSRMVGARFADVGRPKVDALTEALLRITPELKVEAHRRSVLDMDPLAMLDSDVLICATDGHGSRSLLTQLAIQYLIPLVDLGVEVQPGNPLRAGGGVRIIRPGRGCLHCAGTIDPALVREEFLSVTDRLREVERGYIRGAGPPAPSVVALNGVVASLAILEVCHLLTGFLKAPPGRILYRAEARALTRTTMIPRPDCFVCGMEGLLGLGAARTLPRRPPSAA